MAVPRRGSSATTISRETKEPVADLSRRRDRRPEKFCPNGHPHRRAWMASLRWSSAVWAGTHVPVRARNGRRIAYERQGMKRILAATVATTVGLVTAVGMTSSAAQAHTGTPGYTPPPISWGTCANATLKARGAECGFVVVPLDYAHPGGTKIKIAVSRVKHKTANYQGVMLVNPGGPGGSGLIYSVLQPAIPNNVGLDYDWIGFDPRGVGSSEPSLACDG